jgi:hypothetical protein
MGSDIGVSATCLSDVSKMARAGHLYRILSLQEGGWLADQM